MQPFCGCEICRGISIHENFLKALSQRAFAKCTVAQKSGSWSQTDLCSFLVLSRNIARRGLNQCCRKRLMNSCWTYCLSKGVQWMLDTAKRGTKETWKHGVWESESFWRWDVFQLSWLLAVERSLVCDWCWMAGFQMLGHWSEACSRELTFRSTDLSLVGWLSQLDCVFVSRAVLFTCFH